jgi:predicted membrane channel-forming protein YqfA (hemolysin III family)
VSFFYYSYFALMIVCLIPPLFFDKGKRQIEMMVGGLVVATMGHFVYTLVPGKGPVSTLDFEPLNGGFWWNQVEITVANAGAQLDIFPSLHTAYPLFFALHAFGWRHTNPYRYVWFILAFFSANIIVATMFLRWHWFVDVVAGVLLAVLARQAGKFVSERETARGQDGDDRQPVWEPIFPSNTGSSTAE